jgi:hypothetical protein
MKPFPSHKYPVVQNLHKPPFFSFFQKQPPGARSLEFVFENCLRARACDEDCLNLLSREEP